MVRNGVGHLALEHAAANGDAHLVSGTAQRYRREFTDPTFAAWDVVTGAGMAVAAASSNLTITTGTTINAATSLTSKAVFSAPFKAAIGFRISQKIANNDFFFELVAVNDNDETTVDETIVAAWRVSGTDSVTTTIARTEVRNGQAARTQSGNLTTLTQTSDGIFEIVLESDEASFHNKPVNSTGGKSLSNVWNTVAPDPNKLYKVRIRAVNGGTAPASTTTFTSSFVSALDYTETLVEITGGQGRTDASGATPVHIAGGGVGAVNQGTGYNTQQWNAGGWAGFSVDDIVSAAITSTATTATIAPGTVNNVGVLAHSFSIVVTAVTGTTPTMDVAIEESVDNGTNWVRIYEFPRITANGAYVSPLIRSQWGTRFRYVRTIGGTTPSFTMALKRIMFTAPGEIHKQFFDRSIVLTTLNSATPVYNVDGCDFFQLAVNIGAATTAPVLQLQGSEDAVNWYNIGPTLTPIASTTTVAVNKDIFPRFARVIVATAGVTVTAGYVSLKAVRN